MKAILCESFGLPSSLVMREINAPAIHANQVLINVHACGVNFPDALIIQDKYQFKPPLPFSPGGEVAGTIVAVGNAVGNYKVGDRVIGLCGWGGFAEQIAVDASRLFLIPDGISFVQAAALLYNYGTSFYALKNKAQILPGETLLVMGAGSGVGLAAVEIGHLLGANVIAMASTREKLALCKEKGANELLLSTKDDLKNFIKEYTNGKGVDVIFDPIGGNVTAAALRTIAWNGRYLVIGFAVGEIPQIPANQVLLKGCSVQGIFWGNFAEKEPLQQLQNLQQLFQWLQNGKIKPHIHQLYSLTESPNAIQDLMDRKVSGKAMVIMQVEDETISTDQIQQTEKKASQLNDDQQTYTTLVINGTKNIRQYIGHQLGKSNWLRVTQQMINEFAAVTNDFQWVHTDQEKAKKLLPGGKNIAHGYLTLSLASQFLYQLIRIENVQAVLNYGINKARFISPVETGNNIQMEAVINNIEEQGNGQVKIFFNCTIFIEGSEKPAYIAELISLIIP
jgi:NADPH:quinone reductase-like Zn-dependent oxidoreductase/acyl dehydratase